MANKIPAHNTPVTAGQVLGALLSAGASTAAAPLILAQSAFETGGWHGGVWNNNLGNIKESGTYDYFTIKCGEVVNGQNVTQQCSFRSYPTLGAGASDYLSFLNNRGLVTIAATGSLSAYVAKLKAVGYATALSTASGYASYQNGMQAWLTKLAGTVPVYSDPFGAALRRPEVWVAVGLAGAWGLWYVFGDEAAQYGRRRVLNPMGGARRRRPRKLRKRRVG